MIINTTNYDRSIYDITEAEAIVTDHDRLWKSDEQIIREVEQAILRGHGFILTEREDGTWPL